MLGAHRVERRKEAPFLLCAWSEMEKEKTK